MAPNPTDILRFTHFENLSTIIQLNGLYSPNSTPKSNLPYRTIYDESMQESRSKKVVTCGPGGTIHDYVPFYFGYLSPMMLRLKTGRVNGYTEGQQPLIYLVTSAQRVAAANLGYVFTDGHGSAAFTKWFSQLTDLDKVPWDTVYLQYWSDTVDEPDRQRKKQAEFLVRDCCPWQLIESIVVINDSVKQNVESIFAGYPASTHKPIYIQRNWYYN